jgi:hypothetical protein
VNEIEEFRNGYYKDANPNVQRKWCQVMLHFLPCVSSGYHKWDIKKTTPVSQVTHATDEALVLWFLKCYIADWDKMYEDKQHMQYEEHGNKRSRKVGKHKSSEELGEYLNLHARVKLARSEKGSGWDEALMEQARIQEQNKHSITYPDNMQNAPSAYGEAKKSLIMIYSDNEEDLESQDGCIPDVGPVEFQV